jgi:hypothetical protein
MVNGPVVYIKAYRRTEVITNLNPFIAFYYYRNIKARSSQFRCKRLLERVVGYYDTVVTAKIGKSNSKP